MTVASSSSSSEDSVASGGVSPATPVLSTKRRKPPSAGAARYEGNKRRRLSRGWATGGGSPIDNDARSDAGVEHDEEPTLLAQVASCFGKVEIGLSPAMVHVLSRVALEAADVIHNCIKHYTIVFRNLGGDGVCLPASLALQVLGKRVEAICGLCRSGHISVVHLLLSLFLLVTRGRLFKRNRLPTTATPGLVADAIPHDVRHWPVFVQLRVLRMVSPLLGCILQRALEAHDALLVECRMLTEEFCEDADRRAPCAATAPATVRLPSHVRAIALDLDDNIFLHGHIGALRDVYWALSHARHGGTVPAKGASAGLLRDAVLPAVPHRQFLLELLDSCEASGVPLFMVSFGLPDWVVPITHAIFGGRLPLDRIYCMPGHPPMVPVVLNKNMWLADIAERAGVHPAHVLLVDDQASNLARALAGGFSTLHTTPHEGLHAALWRDSLCGAAALAAVERAARRGTPFGVRARTILRALAHSSAAYCPCDGARIYSKEELAGLVPANTCDVHACPPAAAAEEAVVFTACGAAAAAHVRAGSAVAGTGLASPTAATAQPPSPAPGSPTIAAPAVPAAPATPLAAAQAVRPCFTGSAFAPAAPGGKHACAGRPPRPGRVGPNPMASAASAAAGVASSGARAHPGAKVIIVPRVTYAAAVHPAACNTPCNAPPYAEQRPACQQRKRPLPGPVPKEGRRDTSSGPQQPHQGELCFRDHRLTPKAPIASVVAARALHNTLCAREAAMGTEGLQAVRILPQVVAEVLHDAQHGGEEDGEQPETPMSLLPGTPMRPAYVAALASS